PAHIDGGRDPDRRPGGRYPAPAGGWWSTGRAPVRRPSYAPVRRPPYAPVRRPPYGDPPRQTTALTGASAGGRRPARDVPPVRGDGGLVGEPEPPRRLVSLGDPDPGSLPDRRRRHRRHRWQQPDRPGAEQVPAIVDAGDRQRRGQPAGTTGQVPGRPGGAPPPERERQP